MGIFVNLALFFLISSVRGYSLPTGFQVMLLRSSAGFRQTPLRGQRTQDQTVLCGGGERCLSAPEALPDHRAGVHVSRCSEISAVGKLTVIFWPVDTKAAR